MLLRRSVFHSVVDRLRVEAGESVQDDAGEASSSHRVNGLNVSFVAQTAETEYMLMRRLQSAYSDIIADRPELQPEIEFITKALDPCLMPAHLAVLDEQAIAAELGIVATTTLTELNEKRRLFARKNHPDSTTAAFRENATIRMTIANQLIDIAIRERCS